MLNQRPYTLDRVVRLTLGGAVLVGLVWLLSYLSDVLVPFAAALVLAYLLNPLVELLQRLVKNRLACGALELAPVPGRRPGFVVVGGALGGPGDKPGRRAVAGFGQQLGLGPKGVRRASRQTLAHDPIHFRSPGGEGVPGLQRHVEHAGLPGPQDASRPMGALKPGGQLLRSPGRAGGGAALHVLSYAGPGRDQPGLA